MFPFIILNVEGILQGIRITFTIPFEVICAVPGLPFSGHLTISYIPVCDSDGMYKLIEWDSLNEWVRSLRKQTMMAEEVFTYIYSTIQSGLGENDSLKMLMRVESPYHLPTTLEV